MSNGATTSLIARCLTEPGFLGSLEAIRANALQTEMSLSWRAQSLDLGRLRLFGAFIAKVQHNFLWESFPFTVKFMKRAGVELAVFAEYLEQHHRNRKEQGLTQTEKVLRFLRFLRRSTIIIGEPACRGLADVAVHERAGWEIRTALKVNGAAYPSCRVSVPVAAAPFRICKLGRNPQQIVDWLSTPGGGPCPVPPGPMWLLYWADVRSQQLRLTQVDTYSAKVLRAVNGRRSVEEIAQRAAAQTSTRPLKTMPPILRVAASQGLITLPRCRRAIVGARQ